MSHYVKQLHQNGGKMVVKGGGQASNKTPYEIERDNNIINNNSLLKKLNLLTTPIPGENSSCHQVSINRMATRPKGCIASDLEEEDATDPNYVVENNEMSGEDDDNVDDATNEQDGVCYEPAAQLTKKRNVRGPTKMRSIIATQGKMKMDVDINRYGQPCGLKTCNLTNFIAVLVKGGDLSLKYKDWRMIPTEDTKKIWTLVNKYFTIDRSCEQWVMASAAKKWRDFKSTLKKTYFDENLSEEENIANGCDNRIPSSDWTWLVHHWFQEETKAKAEKNKLIRLNQVNALHTCGSRSYAVVCEQLENVLGRELSRAEMYIVGHTKENGEPLNEECQQKIDAIKEKIESNESLATKSVGDDDLYASAFPKEHKGRIRGLGLLPGGSKSIALSRATAAMKRMEMENEELRERVEKAEERCQNAEQRCEKTEQNYSELRSMIQAIQEARSVGVGSPGIGSNNNVEGSPLQGIGYNNNEEGSAGANNEERDLTHDDEVRVDVVDSRREPVGVQQGSKFVRAGEKSSPAIRQNKRKIAATNLHSTSCNNAYHVDGVNQTRITKRVHVDGANQAKITKGQNVDGVNQAKNKKSEQKQIGGGNEVALLSLSGSKIVAYGRLGCTDKNAKGLDGLPLGDFYEVIIDIVLDQSVVLPRVQGQAIKLGAAVGRCIAWPMQNIVQKDGTPLKLSKRATEVHRR